MAKRTTHTTKPRKKLKFRALFFLSIWLLIASVFSGAIYMQASSYNFYRRELNSALRDLEREQKAHNDLRDQISFYESDAYIEQLAREQLGFVKPDEIVFINIAD